MQFKNILLYVHQITVLELLLPVCRSKLVGPGIANVAVYVILEGGFIHAFKKNDLVKMALGKNVGS